LTSANTVDALARRGLNAERCDGTAVAAIGPATAAAARRLGLEVRVVPERHDGMGLGEAVPVLPGQRVLLPAADIARPDLAALLSERGAAVTTVAAYRTVVGQGGVDLPRLLAGGGVDAVTLASSSAVDGLITRLTAEGGTVALLNDVPMVCIGARTRETALDRGFETAIAAARSTLDGLMEALERVLAPIEEEGAAWSRAS
jgi:uroporphyrinogen-III synthase